MERDIPDRASADPCHLLEPSPPGKERECASPWPLFSSPPQSPCHTLTELVAANPSQQASPGWSVETVPVCPAEALLGEWQEQEEEKASVGVGGRACCQAWRFDRSETFPLTGYQARLMESQLYEGPGPCSCGCRVSPAAAEWMRNWREASQDWWGSGEDIFFSQTSSTHVNFPDEEASLEEEISDSTLTEVRGELQLPVLQVVAPAEPTTATIELAQVVQVVADSARPAVGGSVLVTGEERDAAPGSNNLNPSSDGGGDPCEAAGGGGVQEDKLVNETETEPYSDRNNNHGCDADAVTSQKIPEKRNIKAESVDKEAKKRVSHRPVYIDQLFCVHASSLKCYY